MSPATIHSAERLKNKGQRFEDNSIKHLQYIHSATYRPLEDIFIHELITAEEGNPNLELYCSMLHDIRRFMLHTGVTATYMCNNIALRAVDPSFSMKSTEANYTLPLDEFQNTVVSQTAAKKATREATANRRARYPFCRFGPSGSFSNIPDQQFFLIGPTSQQGGYNKINSNTNNSNSNSNDISNKNSNSNSGSNYNNRNNSKFH